MAPLEPWLTGAVTKRQKGPSRRRALREQGKALARDVRHAITKGKKRLVSDCPTFGDDPERAVRLLDRICDDTRGDILGAERARDVEAFLLGWTDGLVHQAAELRQYADDCDAYERQQRARREKAAAVKRRRKPTPAADGTPTSVGAAA